MMSRVEWLRKYALYEGCQNKDCDFVCATCEYKEARNFYESELIKEAAEIFKTQIMLDGTTHAVPFDNSNNN